MPRWSLSQVYLCLLMPLLTFWTYFVNSDSVKHSSSADKRMPWSLSFVQASTENSKKSPKRVFFEAPITRYFLHFVFWDYSRLDWLLAYHQLRGRQFILCRAAPAVLVSRLGATSWQYICRRVRGSHLDADAVGWRAQICTMLSIFLTFVAFAMIEFNSFFYLLA